MMIRIRWDKLSGGKLPRIFDVAPVSTFQADSLRSRPALIDDEMGG